MGRGDKNVNRCIRVMDISPRISVKTMWSIEQHDNNIDGSGAELGDEHELNLTLMVRVEEFPSTIGIDGIIASNNN
jgi:hypothetical protein